MAKFSHSDFPEYDVMRKMRRFELSVLPAILICTTMFASSLSDRILDAHMKADPEEQSSDQRSRRQVFPCTLSNGRTRLGNDRPISFWKDVNGSFFAVLTVETYLDIECNATVIAMCASNGPSSCPLGFIGRANVSRCGPATVQHFQATGNIAGKFFCYLFYERRGEQMAVWWSNTLSTGPETHFPGAH